MAKVNMTLEEKLEEAIVKDGPYEVPGNWVWIKFKYIIQDTKLGLVRGSIEQSNEYTYNYLKMNNISNNGELDLGKLVSVEATDIEVQNFLLKSGDFLFNTRNSRELVGKNTVVKNDFAKTMLFNNNIMRVRFAKVINPQIVSYYLNSPLGQLKLDEVKKVTTNVAAIYAKDLNNIAIPTPPLKEQQRIVDRIESLFEKLDKAKELIEEARDGFENRKAAILEKAFRGELTNISNTNSKEETLGNNDIAFDIFNSRYKLSSLDNIIEEKPRNGYSPKAVEYETSTKTLKLGAITRGYFNENEFKYIDEVINKDSYLWLKNGDFLIQRANSLEYVGISAIYNMEDDIFVYPDLIMKFRVKKDIYNAKLLWYWINSRYGRWYFINNATGTAGNMPKINQKVVMNLPIPIIPFNEQQEIVKILDKLLEEESKIEELTQVEEQIELIKKSILAKAFRGELGTNCGEDESALELLKEILSEN